MEITSEKERIRLVEIIGSYFPVQVIPQEQISWKVTPQCVRHTFERFIISGCSTEVLNKALFVAHPEVALEVSESNIIDGLQCFGVPEWDGRQAVLYLPPSASFRLNWDWGTLYENCDVYSRGRKLMDAIEALSKKGSLEIEQVNGKFSVSWNPSKQHRENNRTSVKFFMGQEPQEFESMVDALIKTYETQTREGSWL